MSFPFFENLRLTLLPWLQILTSVVSGVILGILSLTIWILHIQLQHFFDFRLQLHQTASEVAKLQQQHCCLTQFEKDKKTFPKIYKSFNKKRFNQSINSEAIQLAFQKWQSIYRIETIHLKCDSRIAFNSALSLWKVPTTVTLRILNDYKFYELLNRIQHELPGQAIIKRFSLKRISPLTPEMVKQIKQGKKDINLFEGKIEFDWIHCEEELQTLKAAS